MSEENLPSSTLFERLTTSAASASAVELTSLSSVDSKDCASNDASTDKFTGGFDDSSNISENKSSNTSKAGSRNSTQDLEQEEKHNNVSPQNRSVENDHVKRQKKGAGARKRRATYPQSKSRQELEQEAGWDDSTKVEKSPRNKPAHARALSQNQGSKTGGKMKYDDPLFEKVRQAKEVAERAMKVSVIRTKLGPHWSPLSPRRKSTLGYIRKG